jgi:dolichol-phosphate mannosyltransferase
MKKIQFIIPCFNEEENVASIVNEIGRYSGNDDYVHEFIFVDDGSSDGTFQALCDLQRERQDMQIIKLSRNFGKEAAIAAALNICDADAAIILDGDLQHPPHIIPGMIHEWEKGAAIVDGVKASRQKENPFIRLLSLAFNRLMSLLTGLDFQGASDYKLLDRQALEVLKRIEEKNRFFRGLTNWIGLPHSRIEYHVERRRSGTSKWNSYRLLSLSIDAITSYTSKPLQLVTILGLLALVFSMILGIQTLYNKFFGGAVSGFTTVILVILMMSSFIMISMGILGMYLAKVYDEVKSRPIYVLEERRLGASLAAEEKTTADSSREADHDHSP